MLAALLAFSHPTSAKTSTITDRTRDGIEQAISPDLIDNIQQRT
jgi:hypothetical protein